MVKFFYLLFLIVLPFYNISGQSISTLEKRLEKSSDLIKVKTLNKLSKAYMKKDLQKSISYGKKAIKSTKNINTPDYLKADIYNNLAAAYFFSKNFKRSIDNYKAELNLIKKTSNSKNIARSYYNIAIIYEKTGNYNKAQKNFEYSLEYANKTRDVILQASVYKALSAINEQQNNDAGALKNLKGYLRLMDKDYRNTRNILISRIEAEKGVVEELEKDTKEKAKQIDSLNYEKELLN